MPNYISSRSIDYSLCITEKRADRYKSKSTNLVNSLDLAGLSTCEINFVLLFEKVLLYVLFLLFASLYSSVIQSGSA